MKRKKSRAARPRRMAQPDCVRAGDVDELQRMVLGNGHVEESIVFRLKIVETRIKFLIAIGAATAAGVGTLVTNLLISLISKGGVA